MMGGMVKDVFDFLMLLILVLLGFAGALTTLFASDLDIEDYPGYIEDYPNNKMADSDCLVLMGHNSSFIAVRAQLLTLTRGRPRTNSWPTLELTPVALPHSRSAWHISYT